MILIADTLGQLRTLLRDHAEIGPFVEQRVYVPRLPRKVMKTEPRKAIVLRHGGGQGNAGSAGGVAGAGNIKVHTQRVDAVSYGETHYEAGRVARAVAHYFKYMAREGEQTLIHYVNFAGGFVQGVDPNTEWPFIWQSFAVLAGDEELTP